MKTVENIQYFHEYFFHIDSTFYKYLKECEAVEKPSPIFIFMEIDLFTYAEKF